MEIIQRLRIDAVQQSTSTAAQMLQKTRPNTQHPSTSRDAEKGSTIMPNRRSAMAKLTMKKLVTVCNCLLHTTDRITKIFPTIATKIKTERKIPTPTTCESIVKFLHVVMLSFGNIWSETDPLKEVKNSPWLLSFLKLESVILKRHKEK